VNGGESSASHVVPAITRSLDAIHVRPHVHCAQKLHGNVGDCEQSQGDQTAPSLWISRESNASRIAAADQGNVSDSERQTQTSPKNIGGDQGAPRQKSWLVGLATPLTNRGWGRSDHSAGTGAGAGAGAGAGKEEGCISEGTWLTNIVGRSGGDAFANISWWLGTGVTPGGRVKEDEGDPLARLSQKDSSQRATRVPRLDLSTAKAAVLTHDELETYDWIMDIGEPGTSGVVDLTKHRGAGDAPLAGTPRARLAEVSVKSACLSGAVSYLNGCYYACMYLNIQFYSFACSLCSLLGAGACTSGSRCQGTGEKRAREGRSVPKPRRLDPENRTSSLFTVARGSGGTGSRRL